MKLAWEQAAVNTSPPRAAAVSPRDVQAGRKHPLSTPLSLLHPHPGIILGPEGPWPNQTISQGTQDPSLTLGNSPSCSLSLFLKACPLFSAGICWVSASSCRHLSPITWRLMASCIPGDRTRLGGGRWQPEPPPRSPGTSLEQETLAEHTSLLCSPHTNVRGCREVNRRIKGTKIDQRPQPNPRSTTSRQASAKSSL